MILASLIVGWSGSLFALPAGSFNGEQNNRPEITLALPRLAVNAGGELSLPLSVSGLTGQEIFSLYLKVEIDTTVIQVLGVQKTGVTQNWQSPTWNVVNGELQISHFGISPFISDGNALLINIAAVGTETQRSLLDFTLAALNEGNPPCTTQYGIVYIGNPNPYFDVQEDLQVMAGDMITLEVHAHDPLDKALTLAVQNLPVGAEFLDLGNGNGILNWATTSSSGGVHALQFIATNPDGLFGTMGVQITISSLPSNPQNVSLTLSGNGMLLQWDPVVTDILGNPLAVSYYRIYAADHPFFSIGDASLLGTAFTNSFLVEDALAMGNRAFFQITAVAAGVR